MSKNPHQITTEDAKAALASIDAANNITLSSMKPPLWLILLCAISLGIKTIAMGLMINNSLWNSIQWASYSLCCLSVVSWIIALRVKGIVVKVTDINITKTAIISALLICILLVSSRVGYLQTGSVLYPLIAGLFNAVILTYSLHFKCSQHTRDKGNNNG